MTKQEKFEQVGKRAYRIVKDYDDHKKMLKRHKLRKRRKKKNK